MQVTHPLADRDAPTPAAVTIGTATYSVDADGVIDCPADAAAAVADALADAYGADAAALRSVTTDYTTMTYDELYEAASEAGISGRSSMDKDALIAALRAEA